MQKPDWVGVCDDGVVVDGTEAVVEEAGVVEEA
jgi:hypothetical protein